MGLVALGALVYSTLAFVARIWALALPDQALHSRSSLPPFVQQKHSGIHDEDNCCWTMG